MSEMIEVQGRSITTITTEIRVITRQAQQVLLSAIIEIGRRLTEAKELVEHGRWGEYLQKELGFSQSTANNYMQLYREYGNDQQSLFSPNSQALGNLNYTQALRLLALPAEERESFVAENDVQAMSTRELEKAIRERDEARQAQQEAEDAARIAVQDAQRMQREQEKRIQDADAKAAKVAALEQELAQARKNTAELRKQLKAAKEAPQVPEKVLEQMRQEAQLAAAQEAEKELEGKLAQATGDLKQQLAAREAQIQALEKERKAQAISDPDVTAVQVLGKKILEDWNTCVGHWKKAAGRKAENEEPLRRYLTAVVAKMGESLGVEG